MGDGMKRSPLLPLLGGLAALLAAGLLLWPRAGTRPFRDLTAGDARPFQRFTAGDPQPFQELTARDIQSVKVGLYPPGAEFTLTREEIEELAPLLNGVVVYQRDDSYREYDGQACLFTLTLADGSRTTVNAYNPFLIVDGVGRRCEYGPCEALSHFANTLRD